MPNMRIVRLILSVLLGLFITSNLLADIKYVYKARKFMVGKAKMIYQMKEGFYQGEPVSYISAYAVGTAFGSKVNELDFKSINNLEEYYPLTNSFCEHPKAVLQTHKCMNSQFLDDGNIFFRRYDAKNAELEEFTSETSSIEKTGPYADYPDFDPEYDRLYDFASMLLLTPHLSFTNEEPAHIFFIAYNDAIRRVELRLKRTLSRSLMEVSINLLEGSPKDFNNNMPYKILINTDENLITKIYGRHPKYGSYVAKLDRKASQF